VPPNPADACKRVAAIVVDAKFPKAATFYQHFGHDLRHSFASLLINSGRTLYEVQHILGHTQVNTTQRYVT
jgi:site-specific recombinase XerD